MTAEQISVNRADAVAHVRAQLGLASRKPVDWTYEERQNYNKTLAAYIAARPEQFSPAEVVTAGAIAAAAIVPLEDTSLLADIGVFGAEFAAQAASINDAVNPFSESNRKAVFSLVAVGALLYFVGPPIVAAFRASPGRKAKA